MRKSAQLANMDGETGGFDLLNFGIWYFSNSYYLLENCFSLSFEMVKMKYHHCFPTWINTFGHHLEKSLLLTPPRKVLSPSHATKHIQVRSIVAESWEGACFKTQHIKRVQSITQLQKVNNGREMPFSGCQIIVCDNTGLVWNLYRNKCVWLFDQNLQNFASKKVKNRKFA